MAGRRTRDARTTEAEVLELATVNVQVAGEEPTPQVIVPPLPVVNVKVDAEAEEPTGEGNTEQE